MPKKKQAAEELSAEVDAWLAGDETTTIETAPFIYLRRALGGATLKVAAQWARHFNVPTVRRGGALICRRSQFVVAAAAFANAKKQAAASGDTLEGWVGACPPVEDLLVMVKE